MNMNTLPRMVLTVAAVFSSVPALAQNDGTSDKKADFNVKLQAGGAYDSTLSVASLDQTSSQGDSAHVFYGRVGGELYPTERITLKGSYSLSSRRYHEVSEFDQDLGIASLDAAIDLAGITWGLSRHVADAQLASEPLLDLTRDSLYAAKLFSGGVYLRGAYTDSEKRFENNRERNADGEELAADVYYFFNSARSFWSLGVGREVEEASSPAFDNTALKLRARYSHTGSIAGKESRIQLGWRYQDRDYDNEESLPETDNGDTQWLPGTDDPMSPTGAGTRHDRSHVVEAIWTLNFVEWLALETKVEHGQYDSNFDAADYRETGVSASLSLEF
ncbi:hypothetical protein OOT55_06865 [Marinimicrobium sp. C6131]|uniref:hypothetical protein n=1 Tax=Marinimicrobium sp. C6131 TaxID=3022676 RepID=UPI00223CA740|nr:hypothetical protein [Marinimicrobium sp. C6131]UZJ45765.1 hypothetical protein OOT55_06865 [Marinimicrobium sp. C6131]